MSLSRSACWRTAWKGWPPDGHRLCVDVARRRGRAGTRGRAGGGADAATADPLRGGGPGDVPVGRELPAGGGRLVRPNGWLAVRGLPVRGGVPVVQAAP